MEYIEGRSIARSASETGRYLGFGLGLFTPEVAEYLCPLDTDIAADERPYAAVTMFFQCDPHCPINHQTMPAWLSLPGLASLVATILEQIPAGDMPAFNALLDQHRATVRDLIARGDL